MAKPHKATVVERALGWRFRNPRAAALLSEALTHSSYAHEHSDAGPSNERLEFVGDAVIGLLAAKLLFTLRPSPEGELTTRRARVVRQEALAQLARDLDLGAHIRLGEGQRRAGGASEAVLADAYEALVGALFLDGGFGAVEKCLGRAMLRAIDEARVSIDHKTLLQEACHHRGLPPPSYHVLGVEGPPHARHYRCEVAVGGASYGQGDGRSKKAAEQACALVALARLKP